MANNDLVKKSSYLLIADLFYFLLLYCHTATTFAQKM